MANHLPDTGLTNLGKFKTDILAGIHLLHLLLTTHNNVACKDNFIKQLLFLTSRSVQYREAYCCFPFCFGQRNPRVCSDGLSWCIQAHECFFLCNIIHSVWWSFVAFHLQILFEIRLCIKEKQQLASSLLWLLLNVGGGGQDLFIFFNANILLIQVKSSWEGKHLLRGVTYKVQYLHDVFYLFPAVIQN